MSGSLSATGRRPAAAAGKPKLEVSARLSAIGPTATESVNSADDVFDFGSPKTITISAHPGLAC